MVMVESLEVLVFFTLIHFSAVTVPSKPTVSSFCFFTEVGEKNAEWCFRFPDGLGDVNETCDACGGDTSGGDANGGEDIDDEAEEDCPVA